MKSEFRSGNSGWVGYLGHCTGIVLCAGFAVATGAPAHAQSAPLAPNTTNSVEVPVPTKRAGVAPNTSSVVHWHGVYPETAGGFGDFPVPGYVGIPGSLTVSHSAADQDFSYLRNPALRTDYTDPIKYIPIDPSNDIFVTFNGDERLMVDNLSAGDFGFPKAPIHYNPKTGAYTGTQCVKCDNATEIYSRVDLGANIQITPYFRLYGELLDAQINQDAPSSSSASFRNDLVPVQGFAEFNAYFLGGKEGLQVGRQLLYFHWVHLGHSTDSNVYQPVFDGANAYYDNGAIHASFFAYHEVQLEQGILQSYTNDARWFGGMYTTIVTPPVKLAGTRIRANLDLFALNWSESNPPGGDPMQDTSLAEFSAPKAGLETVTFLNGSSHRNTVGFDYYGSWGNWRFDYNAAYQFGEYDNTYNVSAFYTGVQTGYNFAKTPWKPYVYLQGIVSSGGATKNADGHGTMHDFVQGGQSTFPIGPDSFIAETNLYMAEAHVIVNPTPKLNIENFAGAFIRYNDHDAVQSGQASGSPNNYGLTAFVPGSYIGTLLDDRITWNLAPHVTFSTELGYMIGGQVMHEVGAPNWLYSSATIEYKF